jgi:starch synthase
MLKYYSYKLFGILNGVDLHEWNPKTDRYIFQNYDENTWHRKKENKKALQKEMGLEEKDVPLIGFVGRLVEQKGIGLIAGMLERFLNGFDAQFVFLGSGESWAEGFLRSMEYKYPQKLKAYIGFNNALAHKIEAGSDIFLMPSLFEPCGLNQMYSQIYGTPPLVRATGGLEDTVENYNPDTKSGSGFKFYEPSPQALFNTLKWALETYYTQDFETIAKNGMKKDFSWDKSAGNYIDVYNWVLLSKKLRRGK